jgi:hypothetical protein
MILIIVQNNISKEVVELLLFERLPKLLKQNYVSVYLETYYLLEMQTDLFVLLCFLQNVKLQLLITILLLWLIVPEVFQMLQLDRQLTAGGILKLTSF